MTNKPSEGGEETIETAESLNKKINKLQNEIKNLETELKRLKSKPTGRIGVVFIILGSLSLILSVFDSQTPLAQFIPSITGNPQILAFIGLGLVLWGSLFLFIRPISYVKSSLLEATAISIYTTIDRIEKDLKYNSKSYYIPPYPKEVYIPEHLKGLKEMIVFISADDDTKLPSIEGIASNRFMQEDPEGIFISPPGLGLVDQFEKELRMKITQIDLKDLCEILPKIILENLQLAKEVAMEIEENQINLKVTDSLYKHLYQEADLKSIHFIGSPLESAIACAIAISTGKTVTIQESKIHPDSDTIEVIYRLVEG